MKARLSVREAADRVGVSYSTLKQWIYDGAVRTTRTRGGHHRLTELEVQRLLLSAPSAAPATRRPKSSARRDAASPFDSSSARARRSGQAAALVAISGRNQLRGIVEEVRGDGLLVQVRLRIGDQRLTAVITRDAVSELKITRGDEALAIIKSTEVMIGREAPTSSVAPRRQRGRKR